MRKTLLLFVTLLLGTTSLFAQRTPYEYHNRWYFSMQGGPTFFNGDYSFVYFKKGLGIQTFSPFGSVALGYNITDADELRFKASYARHNAMLVTYEDDYYAYSFRKASLFADYVLSFNALGEYYTALNPKFFVGLGLASGFDFNDYDELPGVFPYLTLMPALNFGMLLEYDFPSGFGFVSDLDFHFYLDPFDGQGWNGFPLDIGVELSFGIVYRFKRSKR